MPDPYLLRIQAELEELGIPPTLFAHRSLPVFYEPAELMLVETGPDGREHFLVPEAGAAWRKLSAAAAGDGLSLFVASAFRSLEQQAEIIRRKLSLGRSLVQILTSSAPPGYSEHHTGRAVDVATSGCPPFEEEFEHTEAFQWLMLHAGSYGFTLSFPRENRYGYVYEPWHWCYHSNT